MKFRIKAIIVMIIVISLGIVLICGVNTFNRNTLSGELNVFVNNNNYKYIKEVSEKFEKENPKVKIKITELSNENYQSELMKEINKNNIPNIALANYYEVEKILENKVELLGFSDVIKTYNMNFSNRNLQELYFDGNYVGLPFESYPIVMYLRQDLLKKYGYNYDDINTWSDLIEIGKIIYKKSDRKVKILNGKGTDFDYIRELLFMQNMSKYKDIKKAKQETDKFIKLLKENNILNMDDNHEFLARINSINITDEIKNYKVKCLWTANDAPAMDIGGNRFFMKDGYNLIAFKKDSKDNKIARNFMIFITNNTETSLKYTLEGYLFSSYLYTYKSKEIENTVNNFAGKSPFLVMSNILEKAPNIEDYKEYKKLNR